MGGRHVEHSSSSPSPSKRRGIYDREKRKKEKIGEKDKSVNY